MVADTHWARVWVSIYYDLQFAGLYRQHAKLDAHVLARPAAFTKVTDEAHWHVLQRTGWTDLAHEIRMIFG